jgi:hypothetical protein
MESWRRRRGLHGGNGKGHRRPRHTFAQWVGLRQQRRLLADESEGRSSFLSHTRTRGWMERKGGVGVDGL